MAGYTLQGQIIKQLGTSQGVAVRPDMQSREEVMAAIESSTPHVIVMNYITEDHDWALHGQSLVGLVAATGGALSHGAIISRERGLPFVVNVAGLENVQPGDQIEVNSDLGDVVVNGGGGELEAPGTGKPVLNFAWVGGSRMSSEKQPVTEMVEYLTSLGLWTAEGTTGVAYDNGYAQVTKRVGDEADMLKWLKSRVSYIKNVGTEPPPKPQTTPPERARQPAIATVPDRFIWSEGQGYHQEVTAETEETAPTHQQIADVNGLDWFDVEAMGYIYDDGHADGQYMVDEIPEGLEEWLASNFGVTNVQLTKNDLGVFMASENGATKCSECGSHTLELLSKPDEGPAEVRCLNCGHTFSEDVVVTSGFDKGSPYPENSDKNAPDHSPPKQKWPKKVNSIYNACMREGNGRGNTKAEKESSCAAIAWAQYKKMKRSYKNLDSTKPGFLETAEDDFEKEADLSDYKHWNEEAERVWWEEEGKHPYEPEYDPDDYLDQGREDAAYEELYEWMMDQPPDDLYDIIEDKPTDFVYPYAGELPHDRVVELAKEVLAELGNTEFQSKTAEDERPYHKPLQILERMIQGMDFWDAAKEVGGDISIGEIAGRALRYSEGDVPGAVQLLSNPQMYEQAINSTPPPEDAMAQIPTMPPPPGPEAPALPPEELPAGVTPEDMSIGPTPTAPPPDQGVPMPQAAKVANLYPGKWYTMYHPKYKVPDIVEVLAFDQEGGVEIRFEGDDEVAFPLSIESSELEQYTFEPRESKVARANFSPKEQQDLVDENREGRARNADKLDLEGTHYTPPTYNIVNRENVSDIDFHFLW